MKKFITILALFFLASCKGDPGPVGPEGPSGDGLIGQAFEAEVDFTAENDFTNIIAIPEDIEVYDSDIVAVYMLWNVDAETGNDVWQPLPVSIFYDDGAEAQYAFDHTLADVQLFITGDLDPSTLPKDDRLDQIFRIAVLPVDYVQANNIDMKNMKDVMQAVNKNKIKRLEFNDTIKRR